MKPDPDEMMDAVEDAQYQALMDELANKCRCSFGRPCDGVLKGGMCDEIVYDEDSEDPNEWGEDDDPVETDDLGYEWP